MRPKRRAYKDARYDMLRRLGCCTVCGECDERTRNGGSLCEKCLLERRRKPPSGQLTLPLSGKGGKP